MKSEKFLYCPSCGKLDINRSCRHCNDRRVRMNRIEPMESLHTYEHYIQVASQRLGDAFRWRDVFESDELKTNPQFNIDKYNSLERYHPPFCPICARHYASFTPIEEATCRYCGRYVRLYKTKHDLDYYHNKSMVLYGSFNHVREIVIDEELVNNPLFDEDVANKTTTEHQYQETSVQTSNIPKCPTCQSTNIKKISSTKRAAHGFMFGIFSKTAFSQFECENCGYKW